MTPNALLRASVATLALIAQPAFAQTRPLGTAQESPKPETASD